MLLLISKYNEKGPLLLTVLLLLCFSAPALAQDCAPLPDPVAYFFGGPSFLTKTIDHDQPGIANPAAPMVWPFCFSGEARIRPIWQTITSAEYQDPVRGLTLDLKRDLGFVERGVVLESMARFQFSRFSGRINYEASLNAIKGDFGYFDWPDMRYGLDVDIICNKGFRLGLDADLNRFDGFFAFGLPNGTSGVVKAGLPLTMGVHAAYNPTGYTGLSSSFETRARWPASTGTKITEVEVTAGIKSGATIIGVSAVRGGWRYMQISFGDDTGRKVDVKTSGIYVDYVFFF
jgi:hypothetical protein